MSTPSVKKERRSRRIRDVRRLGPFATKLYKLLLEYNYTVTKMAKDLGIGESVLRRWFHGINQPKKGYWRDIDGRLGRLKQQPVVNPYQPGGVSTQKTLEYILMDFLDAEAAFVPMSRLRWREVRGSTPKTADRHWNRVVRRLRRENVTRIEWIDGATNLLMVRIPWLTDSLALERWVEQRAVV